MELIKLYRSDHPNQIRNIAVTAGLTAALVGAVALGCAFRFGVGCDGLGTFGASFSGAISFGSLAALTCLLFRKLEKEVPVDEESRLRSWFKRVVNHPEFPLKEVDLEACDLKEIRYLHDYVHHIEPCDSANGKLREDAWYAVVAMFEARLGFSFERIYTTKPQHQQQKQISKVLEIAQICKESELR